MFLHELVSEQTNKYGFFEYDAQTYKSSFQEHMRKLYQDISHSELLLISEAFPLVWYMTLT